MAETDLRKRILATLVLMGVFVGAVEFVGRITYRLTFGHGYAPEQVITTLENKMKCGFGQCGRCNVGSFYVCRDGPVVSWEQMQALPDDF